MKICVRSKCKYPRSHARVRRFTTYEKAYVLSQLLVRPEIVRGARARRALARLRRCDGGACRLRVMLVMIDRFQHVMQTTPIKRQRSLLMESMRCFLVEVQKTFQAEAILFEHSDKFVVITQSKDDIWEPRNEHQWKVWFDLLSNSFSAKMGFSISLIVSGEVNHFRHLPRIYEQNKRAITHRIFCPNNALIFAEKIVNYDQKYYVYPSKEEEWMKHAVMRGNPEKAKGIMRDTLLASGEYSPTVINMVVYRLAIAFLDIIDELQKGGFLGFPIEVPNTVLGAPNLAKFDSISEIIDIFSSTIDAIIESLEVKRGDRHSEILDAVKKYLEENYKNSDCCMANAAAVVNMSPAYVGRLYKRYMPKSISESIQEMRLNSAKQMLANNRRMSVKQVAVANGYYDVSYFCKVFKRYLGITPNEYRNNAQSQTSADPTEEESF